GAVGGCLRGGGVRGLVGRIGVADRALAYGRATTCLVGFRRFDPLREPKQTLIAGRQLTIAKVVSAIREAVLPNLRASVDDAHSFTPSTRCSFRSRPFPASIPCATRCHGGIVSPGEESAPR